jgi:hypothetical protein
MQNAESEIEGTVTRRAHYDGEQIRLDEAYRMEPNTKLLVTLLPAGQGDGDREELFRLSTIALARAYGDAEPEYSLEMIRMAIRSMKEGDVVLTPFIGDLDPQRTGRANSTQSPTLVIKEPGPHSG